MSLAQKMLEKMGWKEGEGLGKMRQGMATPLIAQKTDKRSGVIVNAEHKRATEMLPPEKKARMVCSKVFHFHPCQCSTLCVLVHFLFLFE